MVTIQSIKMGEEVCVNYGNFKIDKFLECYGMIPEVEKSEKDELGE